MNQWQVGERNLITDVPGLVVGNAADSELKSGVTVLSADTPFIASVDVMGGAPGSRETELLAPDKLVEAIDALVLSGGSAFGLDAASGVTDGLRQNHRGFQVGPVKVPIVPGAIIFDLINGGNHAWADNPYSELGRRAYEAMCEDFDIGTAGAGTGATTGSVKGGLGSTSLVLPNGVIVGALAVANPHGHVTVPDSGHFWAAPFEMNNEFGGLGMAPMHNPLNIPVNNKFAAYAEQYENKSGPDTLPQGMNTTIGIVATNAVLTKSQLKRLAVAAQDGMARAIVPSHTPLDGDLIFSLSTSELPVDNAGDDAMLLGHAAAVCLSRAIARGIYQARSLDGDTLPSWKSLHGKSERQVHR
ncbi:MAG: P1 family peptidase [Granulosicoccus sp.]